MGLVKFKRPILSPDFVVETVTPTTGTRTLTAGGVSFINSNSTAGSNIWRLPKPRYVGDQKKILVDQGTTDAVGVCHQSTASVFWGSTLNLATATTGAETRSLELIARTTSAWGILGRSTGWTLSASTVDS